MGLWRVIWTGCCGMCCLIPMAWISFSFLDLSSAVTNGIFIDVGPALSSILQGFLPEGLGTLSGILVGGLIGLIMLIFFPLHWALYYRPDNIPMALAIILPWILVGTITSALFCKKAKQGFDTGLAIGLGYALGTSIIVLAIQGFLSGMIGVNIIDIFNGLFTGLTDLPFFVALLTSCLEGGLIGGIFGAFIGSLRYKPDSGSNKGKKRKKAKKGKNSEAGETGDLFDNEPLFGEVKEGKKKGKGKAAGKSKNLCPHCGAKLISGDIFCPNCGSAV
ncbi:MAG: zinc ribbon domain-containing protein [Promethearchaeota archaeon]